MKKRRKRALRIQDDLGQAPLLRAEPKQLDLRAPESPFDTSAGDSELVIGIVGPLGTDNQKIRKLITSRLSTYGYRSHEIRISTDIIPGLAKPHKVPEGPKYERSKALIDFGNLIRKETQNNAILAVAACATIAAKRPNPAGKIQKDAYIISSLKHPEEVTELRRIYGRGFYLFAVHTDTDRRLRYLAQDGPGMSEEHAKELMGVDEYQEEAYGQRSRDTFHISDFFLADENNEDKLRFSVWRCLDLIFGKVTLTPTFNEFAMFMAFASSLRSADLARQVGAVVARDEEILSTGANDCPRAGGGLYWPVFMDNRVKDFPKGRDCEVGHDSNTFEKNKLIEEIVEKFKESERDRVREILRKSKIDDLTEYGRVVHAEMEAMLACARNNLSCVGGTLYCTTFPCHNCAKHIIAAGIREVVYVEPYPKSKALEFHPDAATTERKNKKKVRFKPFVGVGPRQFFSLFSLSLSSGKKLSRKSKDGNVKPWNESGAIPRVAMVSVNYREFEKTAIAYLKAIAGNTEDKNGKPSDIADDKDGTIAVGKTLERIRPV